MAPIIKENLEKFHICYQKNKKISPISLKIKKSQRNRQNIFANSKLKVNFFSKFVNLPVISDDSGLCIKAFKNKPGIYSARWAKKHGWFFKAMVCNIKKMK